MALMNVNVNPARLELLLERIAIALERLVPPIPENRLEFHKRDRLVRYGDDELSSARQEITAHIRTLGLAPAQERKTIDDLVESYRNASGR